MVTGIISHFSQTTHKKSSKLSTLNLCSGIFVVIVSVATLVVCLAWAPLLALFYLCYCYCISNYYWKIFALGYHVFHGFSGCSCRFVRSVKRQQSQTSKCSFPPNFWILFLKLKSIYLFAAAVHDDSEDKNLSWLYNYKLSELPHLSPEVNRSRTETGLQVDKLIQEVTASELDNTEQTPTIEAIPVEPNPTNL